jgi:hypothetical protein
MLTVGRLDDADGGMLFTKVRGGAAAYEPARAFWDPWVAGWDRYDPVGAPARWCWCWCWCRHRCRCRRVGWTTDAQVDAALASLGANTRLDTAVAMSEDRHSVKHHYRHAGWWGRAQGRRRAATGRSCGRCLPSRPVNHRVLRQCPARCWTRQCRGNASGSVGCHNGVGERPGVWRYAQNIG